MDSEDQSDVDTSRILGHASVGWQSGSSFSWRFKTHRATTLPTVGQLFFTGTTGRGAVIGNAELNAEDAWIYEFSTRSTFAFIDASLSAFYMDIDSFITKLAITDDIDSFRNADGGEIYGFNGEVAAEIADVRIEAGFSTLRGELDNGDAMRDIPANQATLRLRWPLLSGSAAMELAQRFESDRVADDNRQEDARSLINASYQRQLGERLTVTIFGRNLLDELYYVSGDRKSALGPERTFGISLNARI